MPAIRGRRPRQAPRSQDGAWIAGGSRLLPATEHRGSYASGLPPPSFGMSSRGTGMTRVDCSPVMSTRVWR